MLGYLGYRAARGQWRLYQNSRKAPGGPWTWQAVLFCILPMSVLWMLVSAVQLSPLFWPLLGANAFGVFLLFVPRMLAAVEDTRLSRLAEREQARRELDPMTPASLRAHADLLDALEAAAPSTVPALTASWQQEPDPDPLEAERRRRVADLFSVKCRICGAPVTVACSPGIGIPHLLVDKRPVTFCHWRRVNDAVAHGTADREQVEAQLGFKLERSP